MHASLDSRARWTAPLAALVLAGCSAIQLAYDNVDWFLVERADYYLDLDTEQRRRAEKLVAARMEVHRREELPEYVDTLIEIRAMLADNLTPAEVEIIKERIPALYRRTMRDTVPGIASLLVEIDDAQIDHLASRIDERNREFREKFMQTSLESRLDARVERSRRMIEFFVGDLREDQLALVRVRRNAMPLTADSWLAYHEVRQQALLVLLRERASREELEAFLIAWWVELAGKPPDLERRMDRTQREWSAMMLELDKTLDADQRKELLDTLDTFIVELGALVPSKQARRQGDPSSVDDDIL
ncbi:MAG: DUF6279 family lipoprotein [Gammaproteobacteria bacterium]|nr:DUF6279 family lipoprotein [Gammaproteobacteria bacterium]